MAMKIDELVKYSWKGQRVLTTKQLAGAYCFAPNTLFHRAEAFNKGEHYFILQGSELKEFKAIYPSANVASMLRLWTKRGAKLQAEIRNDPALLDAYKWLEENYFDVADTPADTAPIAEIPADTADTALQIFQNEEFGTVRTLGDWENPKFCLADVCRILELPQVAKVVQRLDKEVLTTHPLKTAGGTQNFYFVNEDGLYDVILDSRKPSAKKFRKWITSEVLPTLRKTGEYKINPASASAPIENTPSEMILEVGATRDAIKNVFGVAALKEGIALAKAIDLVGKHYNTDLSELNTFLPPATHKVGHLTPTDIGNKLGISAQAVNAKLKDIGLQYKDGKGNWILTDAGIYYGEMMPCVNKYSGHTGYYPLWNDSVLNLLYDQTRLF